MFQRPFNKRSFFRNIILMLAAVALNFMNIAYAMDQNPYPFHSIAETKRFESLTKEIRCVVCQNQNIADSNAPMCL